MAFNINNFKNNLTFGGARPSLFEVQMTLPLNLVAPADGVTDGALTSPGDFARKISFMCKATSIPASTIQPIEVSYFGRKVKVAGNRQFEEWSITVINDEDFMIRRGFETWLAAINGHESNLKNAGASSSPSSYQVEAVVKHFAKNNSTLPIRVYMLQNVFPTAVSSIELDWGTENEIEQFTVQLQYDYWTVLGTPPTGSSI